MRNFTKISRHTTINTRIQDFMLIQIIEQLKRFLLRWPYTILVYAILVLLTGFQNILIPHIYGLLVNSLKTKLVLDDNVMLLVALVGTWTFFQFIEILVHFVDLRIVPALQDFSRMYLVEEVLDRSATNASEIQIGNFLSKLVKFPDFVSDLFYRIKSLVLVQGIGFIYLIGYLFFCHWTLGTSFVFMTLLLCVIAYFFTINCHTLSFQRELEFDNVHEDVQDFFHNLVVVNTNNLQEKETARLKRKSEVAMKAQRDSLACGVAYRALISLVFTGFFVITTVFSYYLYSVGELSFALFVSSFVLTFSVLRMANGFFRDCAHTIHMLGHFETISDFLDELPKSCDSKSTKEWTKKQGPISVSFENVYVQNTFPSPEAPERGCVPGRADDQMREPSSSSSSSNNNSRHRQRQ